MDPQQQPPVVREGSLVKLGFNSGKWQSRHFELRGSELSYFTSKLGTRKGVIQLYHNSVCEEVPMQSHVDRSALGGQVAAQQPVPSFAFKVSTQWKGRGRAFYMYAQSDEDCKGWVAAISEAIKAAPAAPALPQPQIRPGQGMRSAARPPAPGKGQLGQAMALAGAAKQINRQQQQQMQAGGAADPSAQLQQAMGLAGMAQQMGMMQGQQGHANQSAAQMQQAMGLAGMAQQMGMMQGQQGQMAAGRGAEQSAQQMQQAMGLAGMMDGMGLGGGFGGTASGGPMPEPAIKPGTGETCSLKDLPPPPSSAQGRSLPDLSTPAQLTGGGGMANMMAMASSLMGAAKSHQNDPHLSKEDNAAALANKVSAATGRSQHEEDVKAGLRELQEYHMPKGLAGFVVTDQPKLGTLGHQYGLEPLDMVIGAEGRRFTEATTQQDFAALKTTGFNTKQAFLVHIYSFKTKTYRDVNIVMPPGKPNAILGMPASKLPFDEEAIAQAQQAADAELYVKYWRKGPMGAYVSTGDYMPLSGPPPGVDPSSIFVKVWRKTSGVMVSNNDYYPLYVGGPGDQVFVKVWRKRMGMMVSTNDYAPIPPR